MPLKNRLFALLLVVVILALTVSIGYSQVVTQNLGPNGVADWGNQKIRAFGIAGVNPNDPPGAARANAITAARTIAMRNLLESVQGVALTSETTVKNAMVESDVITTRVQGFVKGCKMVGEPKYMSDTSIEVEVEVSMSGLADIFLPKAPDGSTPATVETPASGAYTGLIIDAKGLGVMPAMAPKVVDESNKEVYGSAFVDREWAVRQGMVGYEKDLAAARANQRVTNNPLVVKALKASGANKSDVVISNADAQRLQQATQTQNFLDNCRVMFLLD
jgi:hypothetical protein